ncbi:MAE_28990/MAE_18760 family HEPN-like nuclease [Bradyrhizobium sp. S69]|uniref:MAE_28990/MAE_18760 family HEPN-like nuclease n=1 Tax=Bradyrhizobium sp. S69 TaxID=1641856 RepID=UPI00131C98D0|nr:MAE_28990/MAE_18760 family HEPN-like nuclease [Bradyrhizobium sp. S69]
MHTALLDRNLEALGAVRRHVSFSANLRNQVGQTSFICKARDEKCFDIAAILGDAADTTNWRVIDHCAAITRTYALFESFIWQLLREYLAFLSGSYTLTALGPDFRSKYTRGIGQILVEQDKQRYRGVDISKLIAGVNQAMADEAGYQIQPEALLRAEQNLRMTELQRLFSQCGLAGLDVWVTKHSAVEEFFAAQSRLSETAESELRQIVEYRNEAAHGDVDQVLGPDVLIEFTHFFEALCKSVTDFIQYDTLRRAKEVGKATVVGIISERFHDDIVVAKVTNSTLKIGELIYVFGKGLTMIAEIRSIQLDDVDVQEAVLVEETEVGLRLGVRTRVGCELIRFG